MDDRKEICDALPMEDTVVHQHMEALRKRLFKAVKVDGVVTYKELSEALGQNATFVQQFVTKRSPKRLYDDHVSKITAILDERERGISSEPQAREGDLPIRLADLFAALLKTKNADLQNQVATFIEARLKANQHQSRATETKQAS